MNQMMREYREKRDYIRMKVDTPIELKTNHSHDSFYGVCKDLSGTGMAIEVDQAFALGTELNACLPSHNKSFPPFETIVKVVRASECNNGRYLLGVEIDRVCN